jgi:hypothetical protein
MSKYAELLKHPKWQRKRLEVLEAADWKCTRCGETEVTLNVHHTEYRKGAKPWEYSLDELDCLCEHCHTLEHGKGEPPAGSLSSKRSIWEFLAGFHLQACVEAADHPEIESSAAWMEVKAREYCAAAGYDYDVLEARLRS